MRSRLMHGPPIARSRLSCLSPSRCRAGCHRQHPMARAEPHVRSTRRAELSLLASVRTDRSWPCPALCRCSLRLTLVGEATESNVSFQARPGTHTPGQSQPLVTGPIGASDLRARASCAITILATRLQVRTGRPDAGPRPRLSRQAAGQHRGGKVPARQGARDPGAVRNYCRGIIAGGLKGAHSKVQWRRPPPGGEHIASEPGGSQCPGVTRPAARTTSSTSRVSHRSALTAD
jgi:hypothetical protein